MQFATQDYRGEYISYYDHKYLRVLRYKLDEANSAPESQDFDRYISDNNVRFNHTYGVSAINTMAVSHAFELPLVAALKGCPLCNDNYFTKVRLDEWKPVKDPTSTASDYIDVEPMTGFMMKNQKE